MGLFLGAILLSGCSRETINYQIAESIGTVGVYENNEPVESPQMKQQRLQKESEEAAEELFAQQMEKAEKLAASYRYDEAVEYLKSLEADELTAERIAEAITTYENADSSFMLYEGSIAHLCFPTLIEDALRAFDGDERSYTYASGMITIKEFKAILNSLYENNYILVDIHDIAEINTDERGVTLMDQKELRLPEGKKPVIISQDNVNYSDVKNGDGIATKLVVEDGVVKAVYTDDEGHDLKGEYDLVPVLDAFVEEHPDFSFRGAKGIVSVSGVNGVFGYTVQGFGSGSEEQNAVTAIADAMKENGWRIACAGYKHAYMNDMTLSQLQADIEQWKDEVGSLTGETDILFYPYGAEVAYPSDKLTYLKEQGFAYLCGLWGEQDYLELGDTYLRQTRRFIDGYTLENASDSFTAFFRISDILDSDR
ncbi:MAG: polysaccharide deacetylase family protein [Lachnospiraceae bacterium]|nr:polysaccharide deacetylase family protein [Lachnospiraceae bacterium]